MRCVRLEVGVVLGDAPLDLDRTPHRVDDARELDQRAVARELDDTAAVLGDPRLDELLAQRLEPGVRARLVGFHQPAVTDHVGGQDRGQPAFDSPLVGHGSPPYTYVQRFCATASISVATIPREASAYQSRCSALNPSAAGVGCRC